jgi:hypothetical protein
MLCGVMVLALPLIIIGNAFEETVKEEERYQREREKRLEIKMLQRFGDNDEARKVRNSSVCLSGSLARHRLYRTVAVLGRSICDFWCSNWTQSRQPPETRRRSSDTTRSL